MKRIVGIMALIGVAAFIALTVAYGGNGDDKGGCHKGKGLLGSEDVKFEVENIDNGVKITVTSEKPDIVKKIQEHFARLDKCRDKCKGNCDDDCKGKCGGKCKGKCDDDCKGKCDDDCKGKCGEKCKCGGKCDDKCDDKCKGKCDDDCDGKCKGKGCNCQGHKVK